ncbi:MAG: hypothetical protein WA610_04770 [Thermodesulfovibrionales bacterium]
MKGAIFALLSVFVMMGFGYAGDTNNPPPDYKGQIAERPKLTKGDRWDYKRRDKTIIYEFMEEKDGQLIFQVGWEGRKIFKELRTPELNFLKGPAETCTPYRGPFNFPLYVGKKWEYTHSSSKYLESSGTGESRTIDSRLKVVSYEQIKVPAGTLWAFKIEENRVARGSKSPRGYYTTHWYSPEVKNTVKSEEDNDTWNLELIKYTPGK